MKEPLQKNEIIFSHMPEVKLLNGKLLVLRFLPGVDPVEMEGFLLHRLNTYYTNSGGLVLKGDFYRETTLSTLHTVHEKDARPCHRTLHLPNTLQNEDVLRRYLEEERLRAAEIAPFSQYTIFTEWAKHTLGWLSAIVVVPCGLVYTLISGLFYAEVTGSLEGFHEINGAHYPHYSFLLPDGTKIEKVEQAVALEDAATQEEVARILRRKYPRAVPVQYKRKNPEKSSCRYL